MVALGYFVGERIELLHGQLVGMPRTDPKRASCIQRLTERLLLALISRATVRVRGPFAATEHSEPEPDIAVIAREDHSRAHPSQAFLLIEVASSSLRRYRELKADIYAAAGVPEYWVVDVNAQTLERFTSPLDGHYADRRVFDRTQNVAPMHFPDVGVVLGEIL